MVILLFHHNASYSLPLPTSIFVIHGHFSFGFLYVYLIFYLKIYMTIDGNAWKNISKPMLG